MKLKGKVIQIILNKDIHKYMIVNFVRKDIINTKKDWVVLRNPEYPNGFKGYFLSFKKDKPESTFSILMDSKDIKLGQILEFECEKFMVETFCYILKEKDES